MTGSGKRLVHVSAVALLLVVLGVGLSIWLTWRSASDAATRISMVADILGGGTLVLAVIGAAVATLAYRVTVRTPELRAEVRFGHGVPPMTLFFDPPNTVGCRRIAQFIQCDAHIHLHNDSPAVSARNPAVKVVFLGMGAFTKSDLEGWVGGNHRHGIGWTSAQWDGGANYSIHPKWGRELPVLKLNSLLLLPLEDPAIWLEIVADGFSRSFQLPVVFAQK